VNWNPHIGNIFQVYARADRWDIEAGMQAYHGYHKLMADIAKDCSVPVSIAVGVWAALSPNNGYQSNLDNTRTLIQAFYANKSIEHVKVNTYNPNKRKAWKICQGDDPMSILHAKKTCSFYANTLNPDDPAPVTIDGHMYSVWMLTRFNMSAARIGNGRQYDLIAADFRQTAKVLGLLPNQLQAICWFTWRRIHNMLSDSQLGLFD
jgi:hypothetical protein